MPVRFGDTAGAYRSRMARLGETFATVHEPVHSIEPSDPPIAAVTNGFAASTVPLRLSSVVCTS
jgi:hypothetical protein